MKKLKKIITSIFIAIIALLILGSISMVQAVSAGPLFLGIVSLRRSGYGYKQGGDKVWKIAQYDSLTDKTADLNSTIYCIKGGPGFGSTDMATGGTPTISRYSQKFNLKDFNSIPSPYKEVLPNGTNYNSLMWLLDNIYIMPKDGMDNKVAREKFLKEKIPDELYELVTDDDIDVIQQLAVWYFTNPEENDKYHNKVTNLTVNSKPNEDKDYVAIADLPEYVGHDDEPNGWDREDAIEALYQYYITNAKANSNYVSKNNITKPVEIIKDNATMQKIENNYVAGPYTINELLKLNYELEASYTDINNNPITPKIGIKNENGEIVETQQTIKQLLGKEIYLMMPVSSNIAGIKMTIKTTYTTRTAEYWSVENAPKTEQPVVIVDETPHNFSEEVSIVVPKPFDLSLRKFITEVNGKAVDSRVPVEDTKKLAAGESTTAIYRHRKNPLPVAIGDIVTYTIRVYNEGEIDGYVEEITDHLPDQLEFIVDDQVNIDNGWKIESSSNIKTIKTTHLSKTSETKAGENKIKAFDGNKLSYKEVKIRCKVIPTDPMPNKITNIAEISKFTDGNGQLVTDRDSKEKNINKPKGQELENYKDPEINRGEEYIPGQEDDDDFEKVTLKEFDLSLRKFVTKINETSINTRVPKVDITPLKNDLKTAIYRHQKTPIAVALSDIVEYTIRVYNEGEIDGYVEEIKDHLPEQLEFIVDNEINKRYGWKVDTSNQKIIKTDYLAKAKEKTSGENKIVAFDGTTLSYKEVKVVCKVVSTNPMPNKITNLAEISNFTDGKGNKVTDRDSKENNINKPTGKELEDYKDDEMGKDYIPGQEDDDDFEKLKIKEFDLALRKFVTRINDKEIRNRIPQDEKKNLISGIDTTAIYKHPKAPIAVALSDIVEYTIRVYNEGEVDGYAEEITDHLPEQLEFIVDNEINKQYGWKEDTNNQKIIKTDYLSKANEKSSGENKIVAFDGTTLSYKEVKVVCKVVSTDPMPDKITNLAEISNFKDGKGNKVTDRDSKENNIKKPTGKELENYKDSEMGKDYIPGQEDDDDFEKLKIKEFDLSLRKFITRINDKEIRNRIPQVDTSVLKNGVSTTATYNHPKAPIDVALSDIVEYTIRVYNEGEVDGYAEEITDYLPEQLEFIVNNETNKQYGWKVDSNNSKIIKTDYLAKANEKTSGENKIVAFDGTTLTYKDVKVVCKVVSTNPMPNKITNLAEISNFTDGNANKVIDRDSKENNINKPTGKELENYKDSEIEKEYIPGQEDDDDFEKLKIKEFDLSLRKFITKINEKEVKSRIPKVDTSVLKNGVSTTAIYNHTKIPEKVSVGETIEYTIRVYNEGEVDGYVEEITDHLPEQLEFIVDNETNKQYGWKVDENNQKIIKTDYLSKANENAIGENKIVAFDGTTLTYKDVKVVCKVVTTNPMPIKITNIAEISNFTDGNENKVQDRDSEENNVNVPNGKELENYKDTEIGKEYIPGQQDDDDFEKVLIVKFDLALRKFITAVNNTNITNRDPKVDVSGLINGTSTTAKYEHTKEPVLVSNGNIVTYTIRVYNEGEKDGYAQVVKDDIPEGLKFLENNETNKEYRWIMIDENGNETNDETKAVSIITDYLSKEQENVEGENLIKAFDKETKTISYKDVKVAFEVIEPNTSDRIVINKAQISKDAGKDGEEVEDQDSEPDKWNEGEDDQDIEKVKVQYFDLSLRKWVTQAILTINGQTQVIETGHKAEDDPEDVVKVDLKKNQLSDVVLKFKYKIRVKNEGNIAGYVKEIKDYIPDGLKFVQEDNKLWTQIDEKTIITDQTKDILLRPGETTEVEVVLTWINDKENFGLMVNVAEISKDYNDFDSPDIDSTPDNKKEGEDDIDDAPVIVSVKTGQIIMYTTISMIILSIIISGIVLIKKYII